jgi:hypothetical protein
LPVTSIPPSAPPEQGDADPISIFAVSTGTLGSAAAFAIRLAGSATTVCVEGGPDIFSEPIKVRAAATDG